MQDSWQQRSHNLQNQWHVVSTLCQEIKKQLTRNVGFKRTPKLDPYWKSQPVTYKVSGNQNWICEQRLFSLVHNFSWLEQIGHRLDRQEVRRQRAGDLYNEDGSICVYKPIKGWSTTEKTFHFLLIFKDRTHSWKKWIDIEPGAQFDQAYPVAKRINTLLRHGESPREEDGAIEFWRLEDDLQNKFVYFSILVWCMEEQAGRRRRQQ